MDTIFFYALSGAALLVCVITLILVLRLKRSDGDNTAIMAELRAARRETSETIQSSVGALGNLLAAEQKSTAIAQDKRLAELNTQLADKNDLLLRSVAGGFNGVDERLKASSMQSEQKLDAIRQTLERQITTLSEDNAKKLEQMRQTVDEKLQKTLDDRISQSFRLVSERLEQVYKGLGEMQTLASGVSDLKKVMSNVKTRGILGEIQLGAILKEILPPEQFAENIVTRPGSGCPVEYAVKLPGDGENTVYLPIDAKFPVETYSRLTDAYEGGDRDAVDAALKELERVVRSEAKDIRDKYIEPPFTTDFGILFLPVEGLYAEVVRRGMVESLQRDFKINIAGPTTMAAILNSLQMGFKTLAIQKRSGEVWNILSAVKTEFDTFGDVLRMTQQRLEQAHAELDKLVGVRTRKIQLRLRDVTTLSEEEKCKILDAPGDAEQ